VLLAYLRAAAAVILAVLAATSPAPAPNRPLGDVVVGADVSWPNCPRGLGMRARPSLGKPLPGPSARFVVIGLTNGPAFHPNPCLVSQVAFARDRGLWAGAYAVVTYPTHRQLRTYGGSGPRAGSSRGRLFNTGWAQARQNVARMHEAGLRPPAIWVDVEPVTRPAPWSHRPARNKLVVDGALAGYREAGLRVGLYSVRSLWSQVLGTTAYRLPEWRSAGPRGPAGALATCRSGSFGGGPAVISQWWNSRRDRDLLCPGTPADQVLARWFVRP
jgi:hypothetical protein